MEQRIKVQLVELELNPGKGFHKYVEVYNEQLNSYAYTTIDLFHIDMDAETRTKHKINPIGEPIYYVVSSDSSSISN